MLKKIERHGRTFLIRTTPYGWAMVGEAVEGKLHWEHAIDEEAARQRIWQRLGSVGDPIKDEDMEVIEYDSGKEPVWQLP